VQRSDDAYSPPDLLGYNRSTMNIEYQHPSSTDLSAKRPNLNKRLKKYKHPRCAKPGVPPHASPTAGKCHEIPIPMSHTSSPSRENPSRHHAGDGFLTALRCWNEITESQCLAQCFGKDGIGKGCVFKVGFTDTNISQVGSIQYRSAKIGSG